MLPASGLNSIEDLKSLNVLADIDLTGKAGFVHNSVNVCLCPGEPRKGISSEFP